MAEMSSTTESWLGGRPGITDATQPLRKKTVSPLPLEARAEASNQSPASTDVSSTHRISQPDIQRSAEDLTDEAIKAFLKAPPPPRPSGLTAFLNRLLHKQ